MRELDNVDVSDYGFFDKLYERVVKFIDDVGVVEINGHNLDGNNSGCENFNLAQAMTDNRISINYEQDVRFTFSVEWFVDIPADIKHCFERDSDTGLYVFNIYVTKSKVYLKCPMGTGRDMKFFTRRRYRTFYFAQSLKRYWNYKDARVFISKLIEHVNSMDKKEWNPTQGELLQGMKRAG
jgi:hypothetical protein